MDDRTHFLIKIILEWRYIITEFNLLFSFRLLYEKKLQTYLKPNVVETLITYFEHSVSFLNHPICDLS